MDSFLSTLVAINTKIYVCFGGFAVISERLTLGVLSHSANVRFCRQSRH